MNRTTLLSSKDLLDIFSASHVATAIYTTEDLLIEAVTDAMLAFWGKDRSVVGLPLSQAVPELVGQRFIDELRSVLQTGVTVTAQGIPAKLPVDGEQQTKYYDYEYRALRNANGEIYCLLHTASDVTERILGNEAIEREHVQRKALDREQSLNEELAAANEELTAINEELDQSRQNLFDLNEELELRVKERTRVAETASYRLRAMVMNTPIAMTILRGHDLIVEVANQPMLDVWRRRLDQVAGRGLVEIFPELNDQPNPTRMRGVMQSGKRFTLPETEVILGTVDGELKKHYARFSYDPIFEPDGVIDSILVTVINITDEVLNRQQLEQSREDLAAANEEMTSANEQLLAISRELEESNVRLNMAIEASAIGITEANLVTGQMNANEQFKKNFGRTPDQEFTYPQLFDSMLPQYRDEMRRRIQTAIETNGIYEAEYEIEWPDGSRHWISAHGIPRYDDGIATRIIGVSTLITEQKNLEQQKDDFLSVASHELKTPITALKANLQLLQRIKADAANPMVPKLIDAANRGMEKITVLVDDLLNIKRFSHENLELQCSEFNVYKMLQDSCTAIRLENKYEIQIEGDQELNVFADEHRIEQVVVNFVNNAVKYAPNSMRILLSIQKLDKRVKISVQDHGPGIPPEQLPHLFDRYWRADHGGRKYSGLGLGLYICAEIIERHGGEIGADSVLGEGSTFWFVIPAA